VRGGVKVHCDVEFGEEEGEGSSGVCLFNYGSRALPRMQVTCVCS
jgi:hypothetical protein